MKFRQNSYLNWVKIERFLTLLQGRNDLAIAFFIVLTAAMMIMPMPSWAVDIFIAGNMCISLTLLMITIYIPSPVYFSTFPSVLLLTTLFRLSLSITTTRLILLEADAGDIVTAFGDFVVGGNIVVGLVMFLIISVVQFIVVTKGAERVAEVSARFTLDGLPGKQMAIDGDMRAGLIDLEQARQRRSVVQKESSLYGSLDGAMKFVKGDAIAGIFITLINIFGGLTIGVMQKDMDFSSAMEIYTILTIGDGLVAQIPALMISMTAGILVTRITSTDNNDLGSEISGQILGQPMAMQVSAGVMLCMATIPGFPSSILIITGLIVGAIGFSIQQVNNRKTKEYGEYFSELNAKKNIAQTVSGSDGTQSLLNVAPISLVLSSSFQYKTLPASLNESFDKIRNNIFSDLGIWSPSIHLVFSDKLDAGQYQINLQEVPIDSGAINPDCIAIFGDRTQIEMMNISYQDGGIINGTRFVWANKKHKDKLKVNGYKHFETGQFFAEKVREVLSTNASEFVGIQETRQLLDQYIGQAPELIKELTAIIQLPVIAAVLKKLLHENIPVRNIISIMEAMLQVGQDVKDPVILTEYVRQKLKRQISHRFSYDKKLIAILISPEIEDIIRTASNDSNQGSLNPDLQKSIIQQVSQFINASGEVLVKPVVLASADVRRFIRIVIEREIAYIPILAYQEITPDITVKPIGRVSIE